MLMRYLDVVCQGGLLPDKSTRETRHRVADTLRHRQRRVSPEDRPHTADIIPDDAHVL